MIKGARKLATQHITIRVPWHDSGWNGRVCAAPSGNTSCLALTRIADRKRADEDDIAGQPFDLLDAALRPPCVEERAGFMSGADLILRKSHPYANSQKETHGHFAETSLRLDAFSAACVPFAWMLTENAGPDETGISDELKLDFDPQREPDLGFKTNWIQEKTNQLVMLDTFFGALEPKTSLCFFYAKRTPLAEDPRRVIVGVGRVTGVGPSTEYNYSAPGELKGMLWERCVRHSIRKGEETDGFLMPYHELLATADSEINLLPCIAFAPEDEFESYSYGAEHLGNDAAIASLLSCAAALRATAENVDVTCTKALRWIDKELARLWVARGAHPGLGSALSAFGCDYGALLAHEIVRAGAVDGEVFDAFAFIDAFVENPKLFRKAKDFGFGSGYRSKWKGLKTSRRALLDLLARCDLTPDQAFRAFDENSKDLHPPTDDAALLSNPYLLFERNQLGPERISFGTIDRGVYPTEAVRKKVPLQDPSAMDDGIDRRRVRAFASDLLERAADEEGHTLIPRNWLSRASRAAPLDPGCHLSGDLLEMNKSWLEEVVAPAKLSDGAPAHKLVRYVEAKEEITRTVRKRVAARRHEVTCNWRKLIDDEFGDIPAGDNSQPGEELRREEKARALEEISCARFSVLIGPAGSGKTTLLKLLSKIPGVEDSKILLLAPTGKARVRLEEATGRVGQGQTIAQFLNRIGRFDVDSGRYHWQTSSEPERGYRTVIVDECSMLTEDQLAALFHGLKGVHRLILVGDYRQLPPIGAGRPFFDICLELSPVGDSFAFPRIAPGYAELTEIARQKGDNRDDVLLAQQFSGDASDVGADEVWERLAKGTLNNVKTVRWSGPSAVQETLIKELVSGLGLKGEDDESGFERSIGGEPFGQGVFFWAQNPGKSINGAAARAAEWQILSPIRATPAGVDALNLAVQRSFRSGKKRWAEQTYGSKIPKPAGPQGLLYGDKVINLRNNGKRGTYPILENAYVANGDIGIVVGGYKTKNMKKRPWNLEVEFTSQLGTKFIFKPWEFAGDDGSPDLELAYALTVHKTQGSQFTQTFLVIPRNCRPLSRELLYTAMTRHKGKLVILHEDEIDALRRFSEPSASEIARRMTDLFDTPKPVAVPMGKETIILDDHLLHRTSRGELVRSKGELTIANKLNEMGIDYVYEQPTELCGSLRWPDFTIEDDESGITYYWEHLGMLDNPTYANRWAKKRELYLADGVVPFVDASEAERILVETSDGGGRGMDTLEIERIGSIILKRM